MIKSRNSTPNPLNKRATGTPRISLPASYYPVITTAQYLKRMSTMSGRNSRQMNKSALDFSVENPPVVREYHTWKPSYNTIRYRTMSQKPMFKDPYRQNRPIYVQAREILVTDDECFPVLIPAAAVKIEQPVIYQAPRKTVPEIIRYVRKNEKMPLKILDRPTLSTDSFGRKKQELMEISKISDFQSSSANISFSNNINSSRLWNRTKANEKSSVIRRPPRRLMINIDDSKKLPLSAFG